jgi:hypothetical protein
MTLFRPVAVSAPNTGRELNDIRLPQARTLPASTLVASLCDPFLLRTPSGRVLSRLRRVQFPPSCQISLRSELAGDPAEDCAESLGFVASIIGSRHAQQHEVSHGQENVRCGQGVGQARQAGT